MARTGFSTSNYLKLTSAVIAAAPLTMACWGKVAAFGVKNVMMNISQIASATTDNLFLLNTLATGGNVSATAADTGTASAATTAAPPTNAWFHAAAVFASSTDRRAFLNGANKGTNATAKTPAGLNTTGLGLQFSSTLAGSWPGDLAEAAIWNIALSDADILALSKGMSPLQMHPEALVAYWPLLGNNSPENNFKSNPNAMVIVGALTKNVHPRVFLPRRRIIAR